MLLTRARIRETATAIAPPRSRRRWVAWIAAGYVLLVVVVQLGLNAAVVVARAVSDDPRTEFSGVPNFRIVDDQVWAGGQVYDEHTYRKLAAAGLRMVVDLRTGARDDRNEDNPEFLRSLGIDYLRLPVRDGHVPSDEQVEQFMAAVRNAGGPVLLHCGAGAGRSSAFTAAYLRELGRDPHVAQQLSIGAHTAEQLWFVVAGDTNPVIRRFSEAVDAPRRLWSRLGEAF